MLVSPQVSQRLSWVRGFCNIVPSAWKSVSILSLASFSCPSVQFSSVAQSCLTLCDPMNCSTPGLPVHHQLSEFTQTHVHRVSDAIQPSHPLLSPFHPAKKLKSWHNSHYIMTNRWGKTVTDLFSLAQKSLWMVSATMKVKDACSLEEKL